MMRDCCKVTPAWYLVAIEVSIPWTEKPLYWGCQQVMEVSLGEAYAKLLPRSQGKS